MTEMIDIVSIPLYPKMTDQDVKDVIDAVKKIIVHYRLQDGR